MDADLCLLQMNIQSNGEYKESRFKDWCAPSEKDLNASWAGVSDVQICGFAGGTGDWSQREQGPEGCTAGGGEAGTQEGMLWLPQVTLKNVQQGTGEH